MADNQAAFYDKLKEKLQESVSWPSEYLYKFIVPSSETNIQKLTEIFDNLGAVIQTKQSSKGKYTSVSIHIYMKNPDEVINKYKEVGEKVEGVISL